MTCYDYCCCIREVRYVSFFCLRKVLSCFSCGQDAEPALASFLHTTILAHQSMAHSMSFLLANKLSSRTLLGTQLMRMICDAYEDDPVRLIFS